MNAIFSTRELEAQGKRVFELVKNKYPAESTRRFHTIPALKNGLKRLCSTGVVVAVVNSEDELLELALPPALPQSMAVVVILPGRDESLLRVAAALRPALIWFDDNSVEDLMAIIDRIKIDQRVKREELEDLELSWSEGYPRITRFLWHSMKTRGPSIQGLAEIVYYA
ncbi:MAG: hypothetical protein A2Y86_00510 [Candidatus Aminicenantes bacterium RBG_13_62_12]|jgi:hypothetical protein|nr:MAG: hypothetical protein A2Y86_00510 [Candidatus Aminicenantes bacterium RBG_13_62_12]